MRLKLISSFLLTSALLLSGCEGVRGPAGISKEDVDHFPPDILLISPPTDRYIFNDVISLEAFADDPGGEVASISFFVSVPGQDSSDIVLVTDPPYIFSYELPELDNRLETITISAMAEDTSGNITVTPTNLYQRSKYISLDTLSYFDPDGDQGALLMPDAIIELDSLGDPDVTFYFNYLATRFTAPYDCKLIGAEFFFVDPATWEDETIESPSAFWTDISYPDSIGLPGAARDSVRTETHRILYNDWTYVDLRALRDGIEPYDFREGDDFYLKIQSAEFWHEDMKRGLYPVINKDTRSDIDPDPMTDRTWEFEGGSQGRGWGTLRQHFSPDSTEKFDWLIRAIVVNYGEDN
ncbi:MAG: hypothetical protein P9L92_17395 [Candidatus Electryonea clarkiae]|nr:hypothetical protein [Candidatus Electryonea clarkiae]MDP8287279.1 hypothetical protein [Candidatus Electryonea clarkiae]